MRASVCIDIDNVIANTDEVLRSVIRKHSQQGVNLQYQDVVCFDYAFCRDDQGLKIDKEEWCLIHDEFTSNHLACIKPVEGIQDHLRKLAEIFEIHLATTRLEHGREETRRWLLSHSIPHYRLHFATHGEKHLLKEKFVAAIEDDREQALAFYVSGVQAFLVAHPWNAIGPHSPIKRMNNWEELAGALLSLSL